MTSTKSVEDYVQDVVKQLEDLQYKELSETYETLQRMKQSPKHKHGQNYWKVLQCLGEVACDIFARIVTSVEKASCSCHTYQNMCQVVQLFAQSLTTVAVLKRTLLHRADILPVLFKGLRQKEDPGLVRVSFIVLYRLMIVGKAEYAQGYVKLGIVKDCHAHIKSRQGLYGTHPLTTILYCAKILWALAELCDDGVRSTVKKSKAYRELYDYIIKLRKTKLSGDKVQSLYEYFGRLKAHVHTCEIGESTKEAKTPWVPKNVLREDLLQKEDQVYVFCSSPTCRKQQQPGQKLLYCGDCKLTRYCNEECQKHHWRASHKQRCLKRVKTDDWLNNFKSSIQEVPEVKLRVFCTEFSIGKLTVNKERSMVNS